jgi:surface antigen
MLNFRMTVFALAAVALGGCASDPYGTGPREGTGTAVGALTGALIGSAFGGGTGERIGGAIAGAAIGGLIGNLGAPYGWRNQGSGRYGNVVPGPVYVQRGARCRSYTHTVYVNGRPEVVRGTACRNPDGSWTALS